jgi:hypothetical protein
MYSDQMCTTACCTILVNDIVKPVNMRYLYQWGHLRDKQYFYVYLSAVRLNRQVVEFLIALTISD